MENFRFCANENNKSFNRIMSNPIKDEFDKISLIKDIDERNKIIINYQKYRWLNRGDAIKKIIELRLSDEIITAATVVNLSVSSIPFSEATNDQIVEELAMQRDILRERLIMKQAEGKNEH